MKLSKQKKAAILSTIFSCMTFNYSVDAAPLSAVTSFDQSYSDVVLINGSYVKSTIDSNTTVALENQGNGDMKTYLFLDDGKTSAYVGTYSWGSEAGDDYLYNANDWSRPLAQGNPQAAVNVFDAVRKGDYVYLAGSDNGVVGITKIDGGQLSTNSNSIIDDLDSLGMINKDDGWQAWCRALSLDGDYLYASAVISDASWMYDNGYLLKYAIDSYTGELTLISAAKMGVGQQYSSIAKYNNLLFNAGLGDMMDQGTVGNNYGTSLNMAELGSDGEFINKDDNETNAVILPSNVQGYTLRDVKVMPDGTAYIFSTEELASMAGSPSESYVYKTTVSNLYSTSHEDWQVVYASNAAGYESNIDVEYNTKRFWVMDGNNLLIFIDGQDEPIVFNQYDLSSDGYKPVNQGGWSGVVKSESIKGNLTKLREGETKVVNDNAIWKDATLTNQIISTTTLNNDAVIALGNEKLGDLNNNILAAVYAKDGNITVNATGTTLGLQVENGVGTPVGIYTGDGNSAEVNAKTINIITKGVISGNSLNNAIMLDAIEEGTQSAITVNGNVNIAMTGGNGGNGIAVQKTDRWIGDFTDNCYNDEVYTSNHYFSIREASYTAENPAIITINGDVSIKGADNQTWGIEANRDNVFSRFNNAGILTSVNKSQVNISRGVDMDVYGNGVTVKAENSSVTIAEGGQITVPTGTNYGYYALAAYNGTINMNMGKEGKTVGTDDVVLNGDIFALNTGTINLALVTANSKLNGIVDSAGTTNVYLQNGATWNNVQNNGRYVLDYEDAGSGSFDANGNYIGVSRVTNFYGGNSLETAGVIKQGTGSAELKIDNYSGHTVVYYDYDATTPTTIYGGDVKINKAAEGSAIVVSTLPTFNVTDKDTVDAVMESLAGKLYYTDYVDNNDNLNATVQIAEGLVTVAESKRVGDIEFTTLNGQGKLDASSLKDVTTDPTDPPTTDPTDPPTTDPTDPPTTDPTDPPTTDPTDPPTTDPTDPPTTDPTDPPTTDPTDPPTTDPTDPPTTDPTDPPTTDPTDPPTTDPTDPPTTDPTDPPTTDPTDPPTTDPTDPPTTDPTDPPTTDPTDPPTTDPTDPPTTDPTDPPTTDPTDPPTTDPTDPPTTDPEENGNTSTGPSLKNPKVETEVMKGAKSAMAATSMMWRAEANDLMKRMGDLRMAEGEHGIWAKYYSTKYEMDAQNAKYTNNYKAYQLGYDKKVGNWTVGAAASYGDGESTYANGRGDNSVVSLGVYGAWNGKDGQYVDLILKRSKLDNEFTINGGEAIGEMEADYNAWATSISAEYGKRFETKKGFYVEPSAEITMGRVEGSDYTTSTTKAGKLFVQQEDYDTLVGRLGLRVGQKLDKASYYAKLAVAKEFCGDYDTKYADQYGNTNSTSMNFGDTWYEMQIGGTAQLSDNSYIYASYERNFGADVEQKWRVDAGMRFTF